MEGIIPPSAVFMLIKTKIRFPDADQGSLLSGNTKGQVLQGKVSTKLGCNGLCCQQGLHINHDYP